MQILNGGLGETLPVANNIKLLEYNKNLSAQVSLWEANIAVLQGPGGSWVHISADTCNTLVSGIRMPLLPRKGGIWQQKPTCKNHDLT